MKDITIPNPELSTAALEDKLKSLESKMQSESHKLLSNEYTTAWRQVTEIRNLLAGRKRRNENK